MISTDACHYCSCTDERACFDPETEEPCQMVTPGICSVCAKELFCGYADCTICLDRGVAPQTWAKAVRMERMEK